MHSLNDISALGVVVMGVANVDVEGQMIPASSICYSSFPSHSFSRVILYSFCSIIVVSDSLMGTWIVQVGEGYPESETSMG